MHSRLPVDCGLSWATRFPGNTLGRKRMADMGLGQGLRLSHPSSWVLLGDFFGRTVAFNIGKRLPQHDCWLFTAQREHGKAVMKDI